jgi:hypothetical protein
MKRSLGVIAHDMYFLLPHHITPKIFFKLNPMLQRHAQIARLVVEVKKLFRRMHLIYVLPSATGIRL